MRLTQPSYATEVSGEVREDGSGGQGASTGRTTKYDDDPDGVTTAVPGVNPVEQQIARADPLLRNQDRISGVPG